MAELTELFEFLSSPNPAARQIALDNLVGHTVKTDPIRHIFVPSLSAPIWRGADETDDGDSTTGQGSALGSGSGSVAASGSGLGSGSSKTAADDKRKVGMLEDLKVLCRDQAAIAKPALEALINLSDTPAVARHLVSPSFLTFIVSYTTNTTSVLSPLTSMLLSNISSHHSLLPALTSSYIPLVPLPKPSKEGDATWFLPAGTSGSSTIHRDYRDPSILPPNKEAGQEDERPIESVRALVQAFEDGASQGVKEGKGKRKGECHFLASVFANISTVSRLAPTEGALNNQLPSTRSLLLTPYPPFPSPSSRSVISTSEPLLSKIAPFTSHPDTIRRGGALACIKNIALDRKCHAFLLAGEDDRVKLPPGVMAIKGVKRSRNGNDNEIEDVDEDDEAIDEQDEQEVDEAVGREEVVRGVDVLPAVLGPLMGGEEYDIEDMDKLPATLQFLPPTKTRDPDPVLRMMCIEILLLLSTTFTGRQTLRDRGTYPVVRELHKWETDKQIKEAIERLVSLIEGEEGRETRGDQVEELVKGVKGTTVQDQPNVEQKGGEDEVVEV